VDYRDLTRWNGLDDPTKISVGQTLRLTPPEQAAAGAAPAVEVGTARGSGQVESRPLDAASISQQGVGTASTKTAPKALRLPYSSTNLCDVVQGSAPARGAARVDRAEARGQAEVQTGGEARGQARGQAHGRNGGSRRSRHRFIWPARGQLLASFSEPNNKGVDIAGTSATRSTLRPQGASCTREPASGATAS